MHLSQRKPIVLEVVRIACRRRVPHMCKLALVSHRAHIQQLGRDCRVEDKVAVEQLDFFERFVSPRNALRYVTIPDVGLGLGVVGVRDVLVTTREGRPWVRGLSLEKGHVACVHLVVVNIKCGSTPKLRLRTWSRRM